MGSTSVASVTASGVLVVASGVVCYSYLFSFEIAVSKKLLTSDGARTKTSVSLIKQVALVRKQHEAFGLQGRVVDVALVGQAHPCYKSRTAEYPQSVHQFWISHHFDTHDDVIEWTHFRVAGPLWWESTGHRWIFLTKAVTRIFMFSLNKRLNAQSRRWWFYMLSRLLWRHCNVTWTGSAFCLCQTQLISLWDLNSMSWPRS